MKTRRHNLLFVSIALSVLVVAGVVSAYTDPTAAYPNNSIKPIDTSTANQSKTGALSVEAFIARGNTQFIQNVEIDGTVKQDPNVKDNVVSVGTDTEALGEIHANAYLNSQTLVHNEAAPKALCSDTNGNIIFCN